MMVGALQSRRALFVCRWYRHPHPGFGVGRRGALPQTHGPSIPYTRPMRFAPSAHPLPRRPAQLCASPLRRMRELGQQSDKHRASIGPSAPDKGDANTHPHPNYTFATETRPHHRSGGTPTHAPHRTPPPNTSRAPPPPRSSPGCLDPCLPCVPLRSTRVETAPARCNAPRQPSPPQRARAQLNHWARPLPTRIHAPQPTHSENPPSPSLPTLEGTFSKSLPPPAPSHCLHPLWLY